MPVVVASLQEFRGNDHEMHYRATFDLANADEVVAEGMLVLIPEWMTSVWCSIRNVVAITVVVLAASHAGLNITTTDTIVQLVARIILFGPTMFLSVLILVAVTDARRRRRYRNLQDHTPVPPPDALASILSELLNAPAWEQHAPNSEWFDVL